MKSLSKAAGKMTLATASRLSYNPRGRCPLFEALERREVMDASLQVIHNSPYEAAALVDVYVNNSLLLNDFAFRDATPFVTVPSGVALKVDITAADAPNNAAPVFTATVNLAANTSYVAIAEGDPLATVGPTVFGVAVTNLGRQVAGNPANAEFLVFHGSPDAPAVDVIARGVGTLVDDLAFPEFAADYLSVPPANYTLDVTLSDGLTRVKSYAADLTGAAGAAFVAAASGFVAPGPGQPAFGLLAVFADGTTTLLPEVAPLIAGTSSNDQFEVKLKNGTSNVVEVTRGGSSTQFLTITNPQITIEGGNGADSLTVRYPNGGGLPSIAFDGGAGRDTVLVYGSAGDDEIRLIETGNLSSLAAGTLALKSVTNATVWAGAGHDVVDASGLQTTSTTIYGEAGNDRLVGGRAHDQIFGGLGNDVLVGGRGNDLLAGGLGKDRIVGGPGFDFAFDLLGRSSKNKGLFDLIWF